MGGFYDHGTPGEFFLFSGFTFCWATTMTVLSVLLARQDASLSLVFPTIYLLSALLVVLNVFMEFQGRYDYYHDFCFFSQMFERQNEGH